MGHEHYRAVLHNAKSTGGARFVVAVIADHINAARGYAWLSIDTICTLTGFSRRTVVTHIQTAEQVSDLRVERGAGRRGTHRYFLTLSCGDADALRGQETPAKNGKEPRTSPSAPRVQELHTNAPAHVYVQNLHVSEVDVTAHGPDVARTIPKTDGDVQNLHAGDAESAHKPLVKPLEKEEAGDAASAVAGRGVWGETQLVAHPANAPARPDDDQSSSMIGADDAPLPDDWSPSADVFARAKLLGKSPTQTRVAVIAFRNVCRGFDERHTPGEWETLFVAFAETQWGQPLPPLPPLGSAR
jgi:hypothetical protein